MSDDTYAAYKQRRKTLTGSSSASVYVDTRELQKLSRDLFRVNKVARTEFLKAIKESGEIVAQEARRRSGEFSTHIPPSIKVRRKGVAVRIVAGGENAPMAAPIENKGKGRVRHPVFGREDTWTSKNSPPAYLAPSVNAKTEEVVAAIEEAQRVAFKACGFEMD